VARIDVTRVRKAGGGRNIVEDNIPDMHEKIRELVDGVTYGNPEKVLS
jgi:hypothetical protein